MPRFRPSLIAAACAIAWLSAAASFAQRAEGERSPQGGRAEGSFSIAVVPDTQNMVDYKHQRAEGFPIDASELFLGQMRWIASQAQGRGGDVAFVAGNRTRHRWLAQS